MGLLAEDFALVIDQMRCDGVDVVEVGEIVMAQGGFCTAFDERVPGIYTVIVCPYRHYHLAVAARFETEGEL